MNVSISQSPPVAPDRTFISGQDALSRSLSRLSALSSIGLPAAAGDAGTAVVERFDAQGKRVQNALTGVQQAASAVQTAAEFMGGLTEILSRLSDLATPAQNAARSPADVAARDWNFQAAQQQLRAVLGGSAAQIGGEVVTTPAVTFDGIELFGPEDQPNPPGAAVNQESLPKFRLRGGAINALIQQDGAGNFRLGAADATATDVLKSALQDVADARVAIEAVGARLQLEAVTLQVESENLSSALTPIRNEAVGRENTRAASTSMLLQPGAALLAQANLAPHGALQLLER